MVEFVFVLIRGLGCKWIIYQFMMMERLKIGDHDACVGGFMIIAPCCARECWWCVIEIGVDDGDVTFLVFAAHFRDKGEVPGAIEGGLYLEFKLGEGGGSCVASVVVTVRKDS